MKHLFILALALVPSAFTEGKEFGLPESWNVQEMISGCLTYEDKEAGRKVTEASPVRYAIYRDGRPLTVELCHLKGKLNNGKWFLSQVYRHPDSERKSWNLTAEHYDLDDFGVVWEIAFQEFEHEPEEKEIKEFIDIYEREFTESPSGFELVEEKNTW